MAARSHSHSCQSSSHLGNSYELPKYVRKKMVTLTICHMGVLTTHMKDGLQLVPCPFQGVGTSGTRSLRGVGMSRDGYVLGVCPGGGYVHGWVYLGLRYPPPDMGPQGWISIPWDTGLQGWIPTLRQGTRQITVGKRPIRILLECFLVLYGHLKDVVAVSTW